MSLLGMIEYRYDVVSVFMDVGSVRQPEGWIDPKVGLGAKLHFGEEVFLTAAWRTDALSKGSPELRLFFNRMFRPAARANVRSWSRDPEGARHRHDGGRGRGARERGDAVRALHGGAHRGPRPGHGPDRRSAGPGDAAPDPPRAGRPRRGRGRARPQALALAGAEDLCSSRAITATVSFSTSRSQFLLDGRELDEQARMSFGRLSLRVDEGRLEPAVSFEARVRLQVVTNSSLGRVAGWDQRPAQGRAGHLRLLARRGGGMVNDPCAPPPPGARWAIIWRICREDDDEDRPADDHEDLPAEDHEDLPAEDHEGRPPERRGRTAGGWYPLDVAEAPEPTVRVLSLATGERWSRSDARLSCHGHASGRPRRPVDPGDLRQAGGPRPPRGGRRGAPAARRGAGALGAAHVPQETEVAGDALRRGPGPVRSVANSLDGRPHVVHARTFVGGLLGLVVARSLGARLVYHNEGFYPDERWTAGCGKRARSRIAWPSGSSGRSTPRRTG